MSHMERHNIHRTQTIRICPLEMAERIRKLGKTLIGRITNPEVQNVRSLVSMMPRLWRLEDDRVVGKDLGGGRFRFDFQREEDIVQVLKGEPFHFDHWMVSIVRWERTIDVKQLSPITFWVRLFGVPEHLWEDGILRRIGNELGTVREVDENNAMVKVTVESSWPLCFEKSFRFDTGGEEYLVKMEYEKLFGYCSTCFSLCHDQESCPQRDLCEEEEETELSPSN